ncbi:MAG: AMIN domain-containing protein [Desulfatibacillaceae bacterium]
MQQTIDKCPYCEGENVAVEETKGPARLLGAFYPWVPYQCLECWTRFEVQRSPFESRVVRVLLILLALFFVGLMVLAFWPTRDRAEQKQLAQTARVEQTLPDEALPPEAPAPIMPAPAPGRPDEPLEEPLPSRPDKVAPRAEEPATTAPEPGPGQKPEPEPKASAAPEPAAPPPDNVRTIMSIAPQASENGFRMAILADGPIERHNGFFLPSPPRYVLDLPGEWRAPNRAIPAVRSDLVKSIRLGTHPGKVRVVLDLAADKPLEPGLKSTSRGLVLSLEKG